jgi:uncharacterized protein
MKINKSTRLAIVGVSQQPEKYGYRIFNDLLKHAYSVEGINPKGGNILSKKLYTSLTDLPTRPELVIIVVPPQIGLSVLKECATLGIHDVWMQPGAESSDAVSLAEELGIQLTTACFMSGESIW